MEVRLYREPVLDKPAMLAVWPGIGNIGVIAVDTLRQALEAEEFGEIEPWEFFYPKRVTVRNGVLEDLEFPSNTFYFKKTGGGDLLFFVGEEQPTEPGRPYAEGKKAYRMANLVLDVALRFGCRRVYTSGAAVAPIHHTTKPRAWVVPNEDRLIGELRSYENAILMSDVEGRLGRGRITGLNGLLLGVARKRGLEGVCVMGEIPVYLQGLSIPYPKASESVLEVLNKALGIKAGLEEIAVLVERSEKGIEELYGRFPPEIRGQLDRLKHVSYARPTERGPITEEDKKRILEEIDRFFKPREE
jgi:proteasome assembly chaperone (PAC2) family protein